MQLLIKKILKRIIPYQYILDFKKNSCEKQKRKLGMGEFLTFNKNHILKKRVCIFAFYSDDGKISDVDIYTIKKISKLFTIIFVGDCVMFKSEIAKIIKYVKLIKFERHYKYDFGSYYIGYKLGLSYKIINDNTDLLLMNNSCIGPIFDTNNLFKTMDSKKCDFWGLNSNDDYNYHIQSYFVYFKSNIIRTNHLYNFLKKVKKEDSVNDVIAKYELKLTPYLCQFGFKPDSWIPQHLNYVDVMHERCNLPMNKMCYPLYLINNYKFPFIKKKIFLNEQKCLDNILDICAEIKKINLDLFNLIKNDFFNNC